MKQIKILGNSVTLTSDLTIDEIKKLEKYAPNALKVFEETPDEVCEIFKVGFRECSTFAEDAINEFGITFLRKTNAGNATVTALIPSTVSDKKAFVKDTFATVVKNLVIVEKQAKKAITTVDKEAEAFDKLITIIDEDAE